MIKVLFRDSAQKVMYINVVAYKNVKCAKKRAMKTGIASQIAQQGALLYKNNTSKTTS